LTIFIVQHQSHEPEQKDQNGYDPPFGQYPHLLPIGTFFHPFNGRIQQDHLFYILLYLLDLHHFKYHVATNTMSNQYIFLARILFDFFQHKTYLMVHLALQIKNISILLTDKMVCMRYPHYFHLSLQQSMQFIQKTII